MWRPRQESNLYLALRRRSFYPLNYGGGQWGQQARKATVRIMPQHLPAATDRSTD